MPEMSAREPKLQCALEGVGSPITHMLWETPQVHLRYPADTLGSRKERKGQLEHATYSIAFESYSENTGDPRMDGKDGGSRKARAV